MNRELLSKIVDSLNKDPVDDLDSYPYFSDKSYKAHKIEGKNFNTINLKASSNKVCFIDGGNTELLKSANNSLQLVRVYYTIYQGNKRLKSKKFEFFVLIGSENKENRILYKAKLFDNVVGLEESGLTFDPFDETIKTGIHQTSISKIGSIVRRFSELKAAEKAVEELEKDDLIVLDGFLQSSVTNEEKYFDSLYKTASEKNVIVSGLSKTTTLLTTKGSSIAGVLNRIAPKDKWYYHPVVEINNPKHLAEVFFLKLNEKSRHTFRFELYKNQKCDIDSILSLLIENSKDPVFLGYPYGLIEADRFARVSNHEKEYLRTILMTKIKDKWSTLNSLDAHDILDNIG